MSEWLLAYEPLEIIGNGSFGVIRKVRRISDGVILARKELNFERMCDRDRRQIVSEVNILKDLNHEHIVRYHDRYVDRDAGILYILMEYCSGGDLSSVIKAAQKHNKPIPEDTIWSYFMQILLALRYCHHPNEASKASGSEGQNEKRPPILHRDLKPDNVFLDGSSTVKLGDFGLSKALAQASFANTYVGTPYYMSPELMQEKAYDSKSDIWSLGCLIYELCALKPPFHDAKTHAELSVLIRNGRIPPLPRMYSQTLSSAIKHMLSLNPATRPSSLQLLSIDRLELVFKVSEAEKMLATVKTHKQTVISKEREVTARETALAEKESHILALLAQKDAELASAHQQLNEAHADVDSKIRAAVHARDEELRALVVKREAEVQGVMDSRAEELRLAVVKREEQYDAAWAAREEELMKQVESMVEERVAYEVERIKAEQRARPPLEDLKNVGTNKAGSDRLKTHGRSSSKTGPAYATPITRRLDSYVPPSAMKGVVLTATGEPLATPTPAELATLFGGSPSVGLQFSRIFDHDDDSDDEGGPFSPGLLRPPQSQGGGSTPTGAPPSRLRRPSIRGLASPRPTPQRSATLPASVSDPMGLQPSSSTMSVSSSTGDLPSAIAARSPTLASDPELESDHDNMAPVGYAKRTSIGANRTKAPNLRAVAAANVAGKGSATRPSVASARKASEDARRALLR